jgi:hypothetical protein
MIKCENCGIDNEDGAEKCSLCSHPLNVKLVRNKAIENIILKHLANTSIGDTYLIPNLPINKLSNAIYNYITLDADEYVICLHDSTFWGSAKEGYALTNSALYERINGHNTAIAYTDIKKITSDNHLAIYDHKDKEHGFYFADRKATKQALDEIISYING